MAGTPGLRAVGEARKLADLDQMPLAPTEFVAWVNQVRTVIPGLLALIEELEAALRPFAAVADTFDRDIADDGSVADFYIDNKIHATIRYGDFRRARSTLRGSDG